MSHFMTIRTFCAEFCTGKTRAYELIAAGKIQAVKHGARTMILRTTAEEWAASLPRLPAAPR